MSTRTAHFDRSFFEFLRALKLNNNREWFLANKERFLAAVEGPMLRFIGDFGERLRKMRGSFVADRRRVGGSLFRIYRDTRFSKDKTPFKPAAGARFPHRTRGRGKSVPGFYLHLEPGLCVGGGGIYHPDAGALRRIRNRIVSEPREWERVLRAGMTISGDRLKRAPAGYDPEHRFVEDLKRKDWYSMTTFTEREVLAPDFLDTYVEACAAARPLVQFLTTALGLRW
jgi:uncharacterized protein (TIGR02453 family)